MVVSFLLAGVGLRCLGRGGAEWGPLVGRASQTLGSPPPGIGVFCFAARATHFRPPPLPPSFQEPSFRAGKLVVLGRHVPLRERHVARLAAGRVPLDVPVGAVQPPVFGVQEPIFFPKLSVPLQRLEPGVVAESAPAPAEEQVPVPEAPPEEVQALLALLLAQPVALSRPPLPGQALRSAREVPPLAVAAPLPQPVPLAGTLVLPTGLRAGAGAALLRLRPHLVPGGSPQSEGLVQVQVQVQVAEPHPFSPERER